MKAWGRVSGDITVEEIVHGIWPVSSALAPDKTLDFPLNIFRSWFLLNITAWVEIGLANPDSAWTSKHVYSTIIPRLDDLKNLLKGNYFRVGSRGRYSRPEPGLTSMGITRVCLVMMRDLPTLYSSHRGTVTIIPPVDR
jgi:hypothetical protein